MIFMPRMLRLGMSTNFVWEPRKKRNLVIVVVDDECRFAEQDSGVTKVLEEAALPLLREQACGWSETRAIGFFRLLATPEDANKMLVFIEDWLREIIDQDTRVYFLVDALYGPDGDPTPAIHTINELTKSYSRDHIAYLTKAGNVPAVGLLPNYIKFEKGTEATYAQTHGVLSPEFLAFFGKDWHEDEIVDEAIQFYAQAWEAHWKVKKWQEDCLKDKTSDQLRVLAAWLGLPIDALYKSPDKGESAKSLMIWKEDSLWESPPGRPGERRKIKGKVLKAVLARLGIPFIDPIQFPPTDPIPDEEFITMPCVPCFPFLVSLRSFLWHCEKEVGAVNTVSFFQSPNLNGFCLTLPLENPHGLGEEFRQSVSDLRFCKAHGLTTGTGLEYMSLFTKEYMSLFTCGTETSIVNVVISENQIDVTWGV